MSDAMTPKQLTEIRMRAEAATEGPWLAHDFGHAGEEEPSSIVVHVEMFDHTDLLTHDTETAVAWMPRWERQESDNATFIARARTDVPDLLAEVERLTADNARMRAGIEALHRPVLPVFSWSSGLRFDEPCPECNGKAGVHSCGCWSDEDAEFVCFECSRPSSGYLRRDFSWPCETAALLNPTEGGSDDR